jgi:ABC-2 type transport system ATP-binding protein
MIKTTNLTRKFRRVEAVYDLTLDIAEGSVFALLGPNGAGKSTAIRTILNIYRPTSGRAEVLGVDSRNLSAAEFARIGFVAENQRLPEWMTVGEFLSYCRGFYADWDDTLAAGMVRLFELPLGRKLRHLSRGMRLKAQLASSLAYHPKLIVLDEPFGGLDVLVRDELIEGILDRASESTILVASHDLADIENCATHMAYMDAGRLWFNEEMSSVTSRVREVEVALMQPLEALPATWPGEWLQPETSPSLLRFTDTQFDGQATAERVRAIIPGAGHVSERSLTLRSIFVALARSARKAAA